MTCDVVIQVRFMTAEEGGRSTPVVANRRDGLDYYACPMMIDGNAFDCRIYHQKKDLALGEVYELPVKFLDPQNAMCHMAVGKDLTLWEGKQVAVGKVVRLNGV